MKGNEEDDPVGLPGQMTPATSAGSAYHPAPVFSPIPPQLYPFPSSIDRLDFSDDQLITPVSPACSSTAVVGESCLTLSAKVGLSPILISASEAGLREIPCMVTLTGTNRSIDEIERERTGTDLVCVIDVSGSMSGGKLEMAKHSLSFIVDNLCAKDRVALVVFDDVARRLCPLTICDEVGRSSIQHTISTIHTNGSTNIESGLQLGLKVLQDRRVVNNLSALFLLSDGRDTCGNDPLARCRKTLSAGQRQGGGVLVHTFGFGNDHDSTLMSAVAEEGGGGFQYVEQVEGIAGAFATSFGGVVSIVAREVEVRITANEGEEVPCAVSRLYVRTGLDYFSLPFITANEHKDLIFLLTLPSPALSSPITISPVSLQLTYKDVAGVQQRQETKLTLSLHPAAEEIKENIEEDVYINWYRVKGAEALSAAKEIANAGRLDEARDGLGKILAEMDAAVVQTAPLVRQMRADIEESLSRLRDMQSYHSGGSAHMSSLSSNHYYQYCSPHTQVYSTLQQTTYTIRSTATVPPNPYSSYTVPAQPGQASLPERHASPRFGPPQFVPPGLSEPSTGLPAMPAPKFGPPAMPPAGLPKFGPPLKPSAGLPQFGPPPFAVQAPKFGVPLTPVPQPGGERSASPEEEQPQEETS